MVKFLKRRLAQDLRYSRWSVLVTAIVGVLVASVIFYRIAMDAGYLLGYLSQFKKAIED